LPAWQGEKIGTLLIITATNVVIQMGYQIIFVIGNPAYYTRFGFMDAFEFGLRLPYEPPSGTLMVASLFPGALQGISGRVHYSMAFEKLI
jgi:predicted N-acetyltransferase YhbS